MPKRLSHEDLQAIAEALARFPGGASAEVLGRALDPPLSGRTLRRRLADLLKAGRIARRGEGRSTRYLPLTAVSPGTPADAYAMPEGIVELSLSPPAREIRRYVSRPIAMRTPCTYVRGFLEEYEPNRMAYVPDALKVKLHRIGRPIEAARPAGTFARDILSRLLVDLSWASSRLEGNTYTRLDTEELIRFGKQAAGKDAKETQMILNHKGAIEWLVEGSAEEVGVNRHTFLNLHALLSQNLMADPEASGRLRRRPVEIAGSVYTPLAIPQVVDELFELILLKAQAIVDPFEQAFFLMVHVPYLQPFEDVNKRVSRLAANLPLIHGNLCPLSFVDVPERAYIDGYLGVYELTRVELLLDVFSWAYERSCQRYVVIRDSVAEPDLFSLKYRSALIDVIGGIVRSGGPSGAAAIRERAQGVVEPADMSQFVALAESELARLNAGNIARFRIALPEFRAWRRA